jgi:sugar lactone lactonase YvrE
MKGSPSAVGGAAFLVALLACSIASAADRRQLAPGLITTVPTNGVALNSPFAIAVDKWGNLYIADTLNNVVREVDSNGTISTVAGNGKAKYAGDHGPATSASLSHPVGVAVDAAGNLYISDEGNFVVRKVNADRVITTVAGNGTSGYSGDGGHATKAQIAGALGIAVDRAGDIYIADTGNCVIRKVDSKGKISTVAGDGQAAYGGDGGPATLASLRYPTDVTLDSAGNLYIADYFNGYVRMVDSFHIISTIAGNGAQAYSGDNARAKLASLHGPVRVALDSAGNLYIETDGDGRIRQLNTKYMLNTVAGNGTYGEGGDGGPATSASLKAPYGMAIDAKDNLYIADTGNNRIRMVAGVGFPIKVPLSNSGPGPALVDDADVGTFSSGSGVSDWYFSVATSSTVTFHFAGAQTADTYLHQVGKASDVIHNPGTLLLSPGHYYLESKVAVRATVAPHSTAAPHQDSASPGK